MYACHWLVRRQVPHVCVRPAWSRISESDDSQDYIHILPSRGQVLKCSHSLYSDHHQKAARDWGVTSEEGFITRGRHFFRCRFQTHDTIWVCSCRSLSTFVRYLAEKLISAADLKGWILWNWIQTLQLIYSFFSRKWTWGSVKGSCCTVFYLKGKDFVDILLNLLPIWRSGDWVKSIRIIDNFQIVEYDG